MKKWLAVLALCPLFAIGQETGESCAKIEDSTKRLACYDTVFLNKEISQNTENVSEKKQSVWQYLQNKDEMRASVRYSAVNASLNTANFSFPYGESKLELILRKDPEYGNDVMFVIGNGQFNTCFNGCKITVKFDDQKLETFSMIGPDSGSHDTLFIDGKKNLARFMDKLKKSKKLTVEVAFFNHGKEQFKFDIDGLEWKHF